MKESQNKAQQRIKTRLLDPYAKCRSGKEARGALELDIIYFSGSRGRRDHTAARFLAAGAGENSGKRSGLANSVYGRVAVREGVLVET